MIIHWQAFRYALGLLTRIPVGRVSGGERAAKLSVIYFPVMGLLVGSFGVLAFIVGQQVWNVLVSIVLALAATAIISGGLHEDGLADTADGLGGGWNVEDKLRIMQDSRIGTYGSLALTLMLLLKYSALSAMPVDAVIPTLLCAHLVARWSVLPVLRFGKYLGGKEGMAMPFTDAVDTFKLLFASLYVAGLVAIIVPATWPPVLICCVILSALSLGLCQCKLGGFTGDTLGATTQIVELGTYLTIAAVTP